MKRAIDYREALRFDLISSDYWKCDKWMKSNAQYGKKRRVLSGKLELWRKPVQGMHEKGKRDDWVLGQKRLAISGELCG